MIIILFGTWILAIAISLGVGYKNRNTTLIALGWTLVIILIALVVWVIWGLAGFSRG